MTGASSGQEQSRPRGIARTSGRCERCESQLAADRRDGRPCACPHVAADATQWWSGRNLFFNSPSAGVCLWNEAQATSPSTDGHSLLDFNVFVWKNRRNSQSGCQPFEQPLYFANGETGVRATLTRHRRRHDLPRGRAARPCRTAGTTDSVGVRRTNRVGPVPATRTGRTWPPLFSRSAAAGNSRLLSSVRSSAAIEHGGWRGIEDAQSSPVRTPRARRNALTLLIGVVAFVVAVAAPSVWANVTDRRRGLRAITRKTGSTDRPVGSIPTGFLIG